MSSASIRLTFSRSNQRASNVGGNDLVAGWRPKNRRLVVTNEESPSKRKPDHRWWMIRFEAMQMRPLASELRVAPRCQGVLSPVVTGRAGAADSVRVFGVGLRSSVSDVTDIAFLQPPAIGGLSLDLASKLLELAKSGNAFNLLRRSMLFNADDTGSKKGTANLPLREIFCRPPRYGISRCLETSLSNVAGDHDT